MHLPFEQVPLQQSPLLEHDAVSGAHCVDEHTPLLLQLTVQQSVLAEHDEPGAEQVDAFAAHVPDGSQVIEQQSPEPAHAVPNTPHGWLASTLSPPCFCEQAIIRTKTIQVASERGVIVS
jgi:hypothetical protein